MRSRHVLQYCIRRYLDTQRRNPISPFPPQKPQPNTRRILRSRPRLTTPHHLPQQLSQPHHHTVISSQNLVKKKREIPHANPYCTDIGIPPCAPEHLKLAAGETRQARLVQLESGNGPLICSCGFVGFVCTVAGIDDLVRNGWVGKLFRLR